MHSDSDKGPPEGDASSGGAFIVHPLLSRAGPDDPGRAVQDILDEAEGLARAIHLDIAASEAVRVARSNPATLFGKGHVERLAGVIAALAPEIVIVNQPLSPVQQRNLEKEWQAKVIDRTGLILEIFGARAETKEGRIQVDLAALEYQKSRLVKSWTHLERQRGGGGFMGGPGETQLEIDRRIITDKIAHLKKELENVRKTRELGRKSRERVPFPIVALVGYTNAGKSTLFNRLTGAAVFAENLLFATLDPTLRRLELPSGQGVILSDTVGFISDLPTTLIAAFRATLEQVQYADVILHVRDVSRHDHQAQRQDVIAVLKALGIDYHADDRIFEVLNKIDSCDADQRADIERMARAQDRWLAVSALTGEGTGELLSAIDSFLLRHRRYNRYVLPHGAGKALAWLYDHAEILERRDDGQAVRILAHIEPRDADKFTSHFGFLPEKPKKEDKENVLST